MMDMGVNMMNQAMRHMITVMPPKHKGKYLYFCTNFSKYIFFPLSISCKFPVLFSTFNSTKSQYFKNLSKVIMAISLYAQSFK